MSPVQNQMTLMTWNAGDSLGKALALVKQVSSHSKHCCQAAADES